MPLDFLLWLLALQVKLYIFKGKIILTISKKIIYPIE